MVDLRERRSRSYLPNLSAAVGLLAEESAVDQRVIDIAKNTDSPGSRPNEPNKLCKVLANDFDLGLICTLDP
jgi:hypothetical protein